MSGKIQLNKITLAVEESGKIYVDSDVVIPAESIIGELSAAVTGTSNLTTKGDLGTYSTEPIRLPVGADDYVLTADSTNLHGMAWKAATGGSGGSGSGGGSLPIGMIAPFAFSTVESGWLLCDGAELPYEDASGNPTMFTPLYLKIGTAWNVGYESSGNYSIPDLTGAFIRGFGTHSLDVFPYSSWEGPANIGDRQDASNQYHTHTLDIDDHNVQHTHQYQVGGNGSGTYDSSGYGYPTNTNYTTNTGNMSANSILTHSGGTGYEGGSGRPMNYGVQYMIKY
jgi:microcystin-dependent protein